MRILSIPVRRPAGFTLVETIVTVGLLAVLAAFVVPSVIRKADAADPVKVANDLNAISTALQTFTSGKGDVLLAYENEAIFAQQNGQDIDYVVPDSTILIENPIAVTSTSAHPQQAKAFYDFVRTPEAQAIFAQNGYRPVIDGVESPYDFPKPTGEFTIADLGGWNDVTKTFFDPAGSIMADVETGIGVSVG